MLRPQFRSRWLELKFFHRATSCHATLPRPPCIAGVGDVRRCRQAKSLCMSSDVVWRVNFLTILAPRLLKPLPVPQILAPSSRKRRAAVTPKDAKAQKV